MRTLNHDEIEIVSGGNADAAACVGAIKNGALGGMGAGALTGGAVGSAFFGIGAPVGAFVGGMIGSLVGGAVAIKGSSSCQAQ